MSSWIATSQKFGAAFRAALILFFCWSAVVGGIAHAGQRGALAPIVAQSAVDESRPTVFHIAKQQPDCSKSTAASVAVDNATDADPQTSASLSCECICSLCSLLANGTQSSGDIDLGSLKITREHLDWAAVHFEVNIPPIILS